MKLQYHSSRLARLVGASLIALLALGAMTGTALADDTVGVSVVIAGTRGTLYLAMGIWMLVAGAVLGLATNRNVLPAEVQPGEARA